MSERAAIIVHTPAKLNLFLEILAKRDDGFHEVETLMIAVNIYDRLTVTGLSDGRTHLTCRWASGMEPKPASRDSRHTASTLDALPKDSDNLVWKAVERLRERSGTNAGIAIGLVKRIPAAAGLGGASSDAAAALVAANRAWRLGWSREQLSEVGAELGSDVPFFLTKRDRGPGMAVCRGRGEQIEPLAGMPRLHFVIVRPPVGLSTAKVYAQCTVPERAVSSREFVERLRRAGTVGQLLFNRLQAPAEELSPWIARLRALFDKAECEGHMMSGSGSSYFGICRSARHARRLAGRIRAAGVGRTFQAVTAPHAHQVEAAPQ